MSLQKRVSYSLTHRNLLGLETIYNAKPDKKLINIAELKPRTILDVGSGKSSFIKELRKYGINGVSIDMFNGKPCNTGSHVRGYAEKLPFKKRVFDIVYSTASLFSYFEQPEIQIAALKEINRVLAPGGKLRIYPIFNLNKFKKYLNLAKADMKLTYGHYDPNIHDGWVYEFQKVKKNKKKNIKP